MATTTQRDWPPGVAVPGTPGSASSVRVIGRRALDVASELGPDTVVLNFANPTHPGGGFRAGARGQEEDLCRGSDLYWHLRDSQMYQQEIGPLATDWIIYTPDVPLRRGGTCDFLTCAAPHARHAKSHGMSEQQVEAVVEARVDRVVSLASALHDHAVFGAWGCGHFGNNPRVVASAFARSLARWDFEEVVFAIFDVAPEGPSEIFRHVLTG